MSLQAVFGVPARSYILKYVINSCFLGFRLVLLRLFFGSFFGELVNFVNLILDILVLMLKMLLQFVGRSVSHVHNLPNISILDQIQVAIWVFDPDTSRCFLLFFVEWWGWLPSNSRVKSIPLCFLSVLFLRMSFVLLIKCFITVIHLLLCVFRFNDRVISFVNRFVHRFLLKVLLHLFSFVSLVVIFY